MKLSIVIVAITLASCQTNGTPTAVAVSDSSMHAFDSDAKKSAQAADTLQGTAIYLWVVDFEKKTKSRNEGFKNEYLQVDSLIRGINQLQPQIKLEKVKLSGDTLYTQIKDSEYLGERIGSFGADAYFADVVINLTSISNINFVKIDFEDGSHASPGVWRKSDYEDFKEIK